MPFTTAGFASTSNTLLIWYLQDTANNMQSWEKKPSPGTPTGARHCARPSRAGESQRRHPGRGVGDGELHLRRTWGWQTVLVSVPVRNIQTCLYGNLFASPKAWQMYIISQKAPVQHDICIEKMFSAFLLRLERQSSPKEMNCIRQCHSLKGESGGILLPFILFS